MKFYIVAQYLAQIEKESSRLVITKMLSELISKCPKDEISQLILFLQGQLAPPFKSIPLGIGEKLVVQSISLSTGYGSRKVNEQFNLKGDLGLVAEELISKRKQQPLAFKELTLTDVYNAFMKIAKNAGEGSQMRKIRYLAELFNSSKPVEARYIARFSQGDLRVGIGDPTILDALSYIYSGDKSMREMIERAYNLRSDLSLVAKVLFENPNKLKTFQPTPFYPIRPALAERLPNAEEIFKKLGKCYVEGKYDGMRIQIHKKGNVVKIYSRRLDNVTHMFPDVVEATKSLPYTSMIIEGEAIGYDKKKDRFYPFQFTMLRKRKYGINEMKKVIPLHVYLFDVMLINDKNIMDKSYEQRRKVLFDVVPRNHKLFKTPDYIFANSADDIQSFFNKSVRRGLEGIMAKDKDKPYIAGARKFAWIKLKKSYGGLGDTIDAVVLGYYLGKGKRTAFEFGGLLIGTYNTVRGVFESLARVGSGFTEDEMKLLKDYFEKIKVKRKPNNVDSNIKPDFWVVPKFVIVVTADEITVSPMHTCAKEYFKNKKGLALRFPRMISLRSTKGPYDATTSKEVYEMYKMNK